MVMLIVLLLLWHLYDGLKDNHRLLSDQHTRLTTVNDITLAAVAANHRISLDNISAKQTEGAENVKIKTVIKTVFKDNECAAAPVPVGVTDELRKYADGIRSLAGGANSATTDR